MMARIFFDTLGLLEAEVDTPQKAEEFKAIVFESADGELALRSLERTLGLALVPTEVVTRGRAAFFPLKIIFDIDSTTPRLIVDM